MLLANPTNNKETTEKYLLDSTGKQIGATTFEQIVPSGWSWLWLGIIAVVAVVISLWVFLNTKIECCGIKLVGVIPREYHKLKEREVALRAQL